MKLPNFFIVGAAKCGTTSLYHYLREHPEVFLPERKELNFFAGEDHQNRLDEAAYGRVFERADGHRAVGDPSTSYFYDPGAAARIRRFAGAEARIIVLLRNPVDMAYSLWGHRVRAGGENLSFEAAVEAEPARRNDPRFRETAIGGAHNYFYVDRARYAHQLRRYLDVFGEEGVRVLVFEEFFPSLEQAFPDLCRFLGIDDGFHPSFRVHNASGPPLSTWLRDVVQERRAWKEPIKTVVPERARSWLKTRLYWWNRRREDRLPPLPLVTRVQLWELLEPDIREVETLLGRSLSAVWRKEGRGIARVEKSA